jgi:hypothetical protein
VAAARRPSLSARGGAKLTRAIGDGIVAGMRARLVLSLLCLLGVARAHAAGRERIAIALFNVTGEPIAEEQRVKLRTSLRGGLAAGFDVVPDADVEKAISDRGIAGCDTITCMRSIGESVMVRRVVKATIEVIGTSHFATTLELVDLGEGKSIATANDDCTACNMKEVNDGLSNAAAALKVQLELPPAPPAPPPQPPPAPVETNSHRGLYIGLATASGALFIGSVVTLAVSAAYHGKTNCSSSFPSDERCPTRYNGTPGIIIGAIGAPLTGVATAILAWRAAKSSTRVALVPSVGGGTAALDLDVRW